MPALISHSPAETEALGHEFGRKAQKGGVIALFGDLGAGKTQIVKGLARGLGISARVHSPTFTLVNVYRGGRMPLFHLDLYRLNSMDDLLSAGVPEFLEPDGVTVIEWAEKLEPQRGRKERPMLKVKIEILGETERKIVYDHPGA
ncbi:MAG: tRNA (adenosine(37)-N6)-threonylcarbamoyltransferase complex ATPase subunit type 1 TsaE [Verrucomicrobia bacterium]|nr:tRNA (adenosine(37)-N6)-threonylcarbamoyltransferase complex ATPase subunit type 1 TsaE [Verrucomicrobiota bacterium]MDE3098933.1 tRNA (adenosine(37)-N6)-threonylcarbamoyltransferase complex ATPase subunit type 1 TsaE [Verrucomicrobiota bacterium]